jgi:RimJ/RimL family protein N-acetyltransferase
MSVEITTPRLYLRQLAVADAPVVLSYRGDPSVARFQTWQPRTEADAAAWIGAMAETAVDTPGTWFQMAILLREGDALIGDLGLRFPADEPRQVEFGISLAPQAQGWGYAAEALRSALYYLAADLHKHRVFARVDPRNARSIALLERVGMRREGHLRETCQVRGEWVDDYLYAILDREVLEK